MNCIKCKSEIPQKRVDLGYKECVKCSTVQQYGCVDVVYHKTGNTVQPVDKQTAELINKAARRSGFGVMRGMLAGQSAKQKLTGVGICKVAPVINPSEDVFNEVGSTAVDLLETQGFESASSYIYKQVRESIISIGQSHRLFNILKAMPAYNKPIQLSKPEYNPYSKYEPHQPKAHVSEDISWAFNNWKK
jgi:hypothetical protein